MKSKFIRSLLVLILLLISYTANSAERKLSCDAKSESYGQGWTGNPKSATITVTIFESDNRIAISLSGHPDFVVAAVGTDYEDLEGKNYSTQNHYHIETKQKGSGSSTILDLDRVTGFLDVRSIIKTDSDTITWRITGKCQPISNQRKF